ncbi:class I adenylate-forming enzyme family protein [Williamsia sp. DF01-3]|uniref:class I adenylate-forming enzyme family protein n=1 Tax=Williamsia sp. DF01-3 TaxID=2934157 RepID=UPI001FF6866E|nr:class I adenylate-forming enzyme family protein [Williamsia sp. DF01-3]
MASLLRQVGSEHGDNRALAWLANTGVSGMTWSQVLAESQAVARRLLQLNPSGMRVAIAAPNSVQWVTAMFGCALSGMAIVPLNAGSSPAEAAHVLRQSEVGVVLAVSVFAGAPVRDVLVKIAEELPLKPLVLDLMNLLDTGEGSEVLAHERIGTDEFLIQYTSGTTGHPKAAVLSHTAAVNSARFYAEGALAEVGDGWFNPLPLHHVGGTVAGVLSALWTAGTYVVMERFRSQDAIRIVKEIRPEILGMVPTMLIDLLAMHEVSEADFASVKTVVGGATSVDPDLIEEIERRLSIVFLVGYGQSEAPCLTMSMASDPTLIRTRTLGHPLPGRDYCIARSDNSIAEPGEVGELCMRGPLIMSGYLQDDGEVTNVCDENGWIHSGDLCSLDRRGVLTFAGRLREVIVRGGSNIYPAEVETVISEHSSVAAVAVFGLPDARLGERVAAAVVPTVSGSITPDGLHSFTSERLSKHKVPVEWHIVDELPVTSTGKARKHLLQKQFSE